MIRLPFGLRKRSKALDKYFNTKEACNYLGIKEFGTLYSYIREGKLIAHKLGGNAKSKRHWRIKQVDLEVFISGQKQVEPEASVK